MVASLPVERPIPFTTNFIGTILEGAITYRAWYYLVHVPLRGSGPSVGRTTATPKPVFCAAEGRITPSNAKDRTPPQKRDISLLFIVLSVALDGGHE